MFLLCFVQLLLFYHLPVALPVPKERGGGERIGSGRGGDLGGRGGYPGGEGIALSKPCIVLVAIPVPTAPPGNGFGCATLRDGNEVLHTSYFIFDTKHFTPTSITTDRTESLD